ncbi:MAG: hypothetical protein ABEJ73_09735 [Haloplanus sp.]
MNRVPRHESVNTTAVLGWLGALESGIPVEGQEAFDRSPADLAPVLETELAERWRMYPEAAFEIEDDRPSVTVRANEMLASGFRNPLHNAVQYTDRDVPTVTASATVGDETIRVCVADDGPGAPRRRQGRHLRRG